MTDPVRKILIVGGGSAGWMAAAYLSRALSDTVAIELVESEAVGTVGVGEATIPPIREFNRMAGIDEVEFVRATDATFKVGIEFENWGVPGERYLHAFGHVGQELDAMVRLHHWWLLGKQTGGPDYPQWQELFLGRAAADLDRFAIDQRPGSELSRLLPHAYHFDSLSYGQYLRKVAESRGVKRTEGKIVAVHRASDTGEVTGVGLDGGATLEADFFIDCSGFRSLVLGEAMDVPFDDWSHWLPADRALVVQTENVGETISPMTRAIAHSVGWQWRIPLRSRTGNGHVFSSAFSSEEEATERLLATVSGDLRGDPRLIRFRTGRRQEAWAGNVVGIGLAAGFLEPLESTSIHLVQASLERLVELFPTKAIDPVLRDRFNAQTQQEWEQVRDFVIAHYALTQRDDSEFWRHCRTMELPDTLSTILELWRSHGSVAIDGGHLFQLGSWTSLLLGQNLEPARPHPATARAQPQPIADRIAHIASSLRKSAEGLPDHGQFLARMAGTSS